MVSIEEAGNILREKKVIPLKGVDLGEIYAISVTEEAVKDQALDDNFIGVRKSDGKLVSYNPVMNLQQFHAACAKGVHTF